MYKAVASSEVAAYLPVVRKLARKYTGRSGAERDDLMQEGMISVWEALRRSNIPSAEVIMYAMLQWVRFLRRLQRGDNLATGILPASLTDFSYGEVLREESAKPS